MSDAAFDIRAPFRLVNHRGSPHMQVMAEAAFEAGQGLRHDFARISTLKIRTKGPGDYVSEADERAEETVRRILDRSYAGYSFIMEESGRIDASETKRWFIDPLDGTTNFLRGTPHWCVSIALEERGELTAAVIYDPMQNELFWGEKDVGAFLNNREIHVSGQEEAKGAIISMYPMLENAPVENLKDLHIGFRETGSLCLGLAHVAAGRWDAVVKTHPKIGPWDIAAGGLLVRAAGGIVTDFRNNADFVMGKSIIAAPPKLHADLLRRQPPGLVFA